MSPDDLTNTTRTNDVELTEGQLEEVAGGDLQISKTVDKSSPTLFQNCATGEHLKTS